MALRSSWRRRQGGARLPLSRLFQFRGCRCRTVAQFRNLLILSFALSAFAQTSPARAPFTITIRAVRATVTARQFAYVTNPALSNTCKAGYGYEYTIWYTPYTHPDGAAVPPNIGLTGTKVNESVTPQSGGAVCTNYAETGDAALNANSQVSDFVALCSNSPIPTCDKKYTQTFSVGQSGTVRTNTLEYTNTVLNYTNGGPNQ